MTGTITAVEDAGALITAIVQCADRVRRSLRPDVGAPFWLAVIAALAACGEPTRPEPTVQHVLFLGNSLTHAAPVPAMDWPGGWGMAASDSSRDFAHLLSARFPGAMHAQRSLYAFEVGKVPLDLVLPDSLLAPSPDLIVVQLGDNVDDATQFEARYRALLSHLESATHARILCTNTWYEKVDVDEAIRSACAGERARFVDLAGVRSDLQNFAWSEGLYHRPDVLSHPGDRGMRAIADVLYGALVGWDPGPARR